LIDKRGTIPRDKAKSKKSKANYNIAERLTMLKEEDRKGKERKKEGYYRYFILLSIGRNFFLINVSLINEVETMQYHRSYSLSYFGGNWSSTKHTLTIYVDIIYI